MRRSGCTGGAAKPVSMRARVGIQRSGGERRGRLSSDGSAAVAIRANAARRRGTAGGAVPRLPATRMRLASIGVRGSE